MGGKFHERRSCSRSWRVSEKIEYRELSNFYVSRIFKTKRNSIVGFKDLYYLELYVGNKTDADKAMYRIENIEIDENDNVIKIFIGEYIEIVSN